MWMVAMLTCFKLFCSIIPGWFIALQLVSVNERILHTLCFFQETIFFLKMGDHLKIISQLILFNSIVVCQFNNKMIIFWSKASHCFAPLAIIRTVYKYNEWLANILKYYFVLLHTYHSHSFTKIHKLQEKKLQTLISPSQIHVHLHAAHLIIFIYLQVTEIQFREKCVLPKTIHTSPIKVFF